MKKYFLLLSCFCMAACSAGTGPEPERNGAAAASGQYKIESSYYGPGGNGRGQVNIIYQDGESFALEEQRSLAEQGITDRAQELLMRELPKGGRIMVQFRRPHSELQQLDNYRFTVVDDRGRDLLAHVLRHYAPKSTQSVQAWNATAVLYLNEAFDRLLTVEISNPTRRERWAFQVRRES